MCTTLLKEPLAKLLCMGENNMNLNMYPLQIVQVPHRTVILATYSASLYPRNADTRILICASHYELYHCSDTSPSSAVYRRTANIISLLTVISNGGKCTWALRSTLKITLPVLPYSYCTITVALSCVFPECEAVLSTDLAMTALKGQHFNVPTLH
jgi:hypothetical protein